MGVRNPTRMWIDPETDWLMTGWVGPDAGGPSADLGPATYENAGRDPEGRQLRLAVLHGQQAALPRPRNADNNPDRLVRLRRPEQRLAAQHRPDEPADGRAGDDMWYAAAGGGPVHPIDSTDRAPELRRRAPTLGQPYLAAGGGQADDAGPVLPLRRGAENATKFPEYWDGSGSSTTTTGPSTARAVGLDADTVDDHKPPKTAVDITGIIGKSGAQAMGIEVRP